MGSKRVSGDSLLGKRALVTGASSGIGRAIALRLAEEGASLAVCGRDPERTEQTRAAAEAIGVRAIALTGDVSVEAETRRLVAEAAAFLGGLDVLVNNAGLDVSDGWRPVHETPVESWERILAVNLTGAFLMSRSAIPRMLEGGGGALLHVSSVAAVTVWPGDCAYDVSKAGLNMLSDHIAVEYAQQGIRSNTLMPGAVRTDLHEKLVAASADGAAFEREVIGRHPIGRLGTVEEIAEAALLFCRPGLGFLTGANVLVDGAYSRL
jgi:NAD(P)-dependent dehydrogenase (short-subunit alcohol dehydrogenase family)